MNSIDTIEEAVRDRLATALASFPVRVRRYPKKVSDLGQIDNGDRVIVKLTGQTSTRINKVRLNRIYALQIEVEVEEYGTENGLGEIVHAIEVSLNGWDELIPGSPVYNLSDTEDQITADRRWRQVLQFAVPYVFPPPLGG